MKIPEYPEFAPLELAHGQEISAFLSGMERPVSEWSFANLYLFRAPHGYRVSRRGALLLIKARGYDGTPYLFPPWGEGDLAGAAKALCEDISREGGDPVISPVPRAIYEKWFSGPGWVGTPDRDGADYVYLRENLANLPGSRYHKKKNRLAKYLREVGDGYAYAPLADEHLDACLALARGWCEERCSIERPSTFVETDAAVEALTLRRELGLSGGVGQVGGEVVAYCLGEPLNSDTFVVHFEKAAPGHDGAAQAINRDFCLHSLGGFKYVNREQDLGEPGLRQAKESYYPEYLAEKFRVRPER